MKKIGILTGAGAIVGANFYKNLISSFTYEGVQDKDFPYVMLLNFPFSSTDENGLSHNHLFEKEIFSCLQKTNDTDIFLVLCFSMHEKIKKSDNFLDISSLVKNEIRKEETTLVLCSLTSKKESIFGSFVKYLDDEDYPYLNKIIQDVIEGKKSDISNFKKIIKNYCTKNKIEKIVLGCTELFYADLEDSLSEICEVFNPEKKIIEKIKEIL